jgi:hypothetical protein
MLVEVVIKLTWMVNLVLVVVGVVEMDLGHQARVVAVVVV